MLNYEEAKEMLQLREKVPVYDGMGYFLQKVLGHLEESNPNSERIPKLKELIQNLKVGGKEKRTRLSQLENRLEMEGLEEGLDLARIKENLWDEDKKPTDERKSKPKRKSKAKRKSESSDQERFELSLFRDCDGE